VADLTAICNGLAATIGQIPGLRVSPQFAAQVNPPAAIILPVTGLGLHFDTLDGGVSYSLRVVLLVQYAQDSSSTASLNGYISTTGTYSLAQAIRNSPRLAGVYDYVTMDSIRGYGLMEWGGEQYLGTTAMLTVMAATP
jgi:hypothetical protein